MLINKLQDELNRSTKLSSLSSALSSYDHIDVKTRLEEKTSALQRSEEGLELQIKNSMHVENSLKETIAELQSKYEAVKSELDTIKPPEGVDALQHHAKFLMRQEIQMWEDNLNRLKAENKELKEQNIMFRKKMDTVTELENRVRNFEKERAIREKTDAVLKEMPADMKSLGQLTHLPVSDILENYVKFVVQLNRAPTSTVDGTKEPFSLPASIPFTEKAVIRKEEILHGELKEAADELQLHLRKMKAKNPDIFGQHFIDDAKIEEMLHKFRTFSSNDFGEEQRILKTALAEAGWSHLIENVSSEYTRLQNRITHYKHGKDKELEIKLISEDISNSRNRWEYEQQRNKIGMDMLDKFIEKKKLMDEELHHWENFGGFATVPKEVKEIELIKEKRRESIEVAKRNILTAELKEENMKRWLNKEETEFDTAEKKDQISERDHEDDVRKQTKKFVECLLALSSLICNLADFRQKREVRRRDMREKRKFADATLESWVDYRKSEEKILDIRLRQSEVITIGQEIYDACFQGAQKK